MKLRDIKTVDDFWEVADVQYQRGKALVRASRDEAKPGSYRLRAFRLSMLMWTRIMKIQQIGIKINTRPLSKDFPSGGWSE